MARDLRNLLLVVVVGGIIGFLAASPEKQINGPKVGAGAQQAAKLSSDQQLAELQNQKRVRVEKLRQQQTQPRLATARDLLNERIASILADGATLHEVEMLAPIINGDQSAPLNPALEAALASGQPLTINELVLLNGYPSPSPSMAYPGISQQSAYAQSVEATAPRPIQPPPSVLDQPSASREYRQRQPQTSIPESGIGSTQILNPAGPGTYSDGSGDIYAQAGPHGVDNTRTGAFSPTN